MCGIIGRYSLRPDPASKSVEILKAQLEMLRHRGPDDSQVTVPDERVVLGHVRLSVIDLSDESRQPMSSANNRYHLVYNGEIYNYLELRSDLETLGHQFRSSGDTEVLLAACVEWGVAEASRRLNGMFAFAFYDSQIGTLELSRDLFGIKPLFYRHLPGSQSLEFSSELKVFGQAAPKTSMVYAMLLGEPTLAPETPWEHVYELLPGHALSIDPSSQLTKNSVPWRQLSDFVSPEMYRELSRLKHADYCRRYAETFSRAMERTTRSDADVGVAVSGGIDSSLIAGCGVRSREIAGFYHADVVGYESELHFAEQIADRFSTPLKVAECNAQNFLESLPELTWYNDFPLGYHSNSVPYAMMSRLASRDVKVLLTGEGADELNGGYAFPEKELDRELRCQRAESVARRLRQLRLKPLENLIRNYTTGLRSGSSEYQRLKSVLSRNASISWRLEAEEAYKFLPEGRERELQQRYFVTCKGHLQSLLWRNDRMGMYASVESRFPFLDNELATLQLSTPFRFKHQRNVRKTALRHAALQCGVPASLVNRPKVGFTVNPNSHVGDQSRLFESGYLEQHLDGLENLFCESDWDVFYFYFVAIGVWGRLFCLNQSPQEVTSLLTTE